MSVEKLETRRTRHAAAREVTRHEPRPHRGYAAERRSRRIRQGVFGLVIAGVVTVGGYLAFGDLVGQRGVATTADAIPVRLSMAGFTPSDSVSRPGRP